MESEFIELHVIFKGRVQGVGFRYTTKKHADDLSLAGNVSNLSDGTVELIVCGKLEQVKNLINRIENSFPKNSFSYQILSKNNPQKKYSSFEIL